MTNRCLYVGAYRKTSKQKFNSIEIKKKAKNDFKMRLIACITSTTFDGTPSREKHKNPKINK